MYTLPNKDFLPSFLPSFVIIFNLIMLTYLYTIYIQEVTSYLGSLITEDGRSGKEIKRRIMVARTTFTNMRTLLSCRGINLKTTLRAITCYTACIWPTLFYGAETRTITKSLLSRLDAFEMWVYRRVLKIAWTENISNEELLRRMGTGKEIVRQSETRKLQYLGHLIRHNTS